MDTLQQGQTLKACFAHSPCIVEGLLGSGTQGEVYKASLNDQAYAVKWYFPEFATDPQKANIQRLIEEGSPSSRFVWPFDTVALPNGSGFGYLMPLIPPNYVSPSKVLSRKVDPSWYVLATVGYLAADSYLTLHSTGYCYRDISFGNIVFDPQTGETLICDCDNVTPEGLDEFSQIIGTPLFMAPEILRGEAIPSIQTDLYSLAVLLFYLLVLNHPLDGAREAQIRCFDFEAMNRLYGYEPLFIFDPDDASNRPVPGIHDNALILWELLPSALKELFTRTFTAGLTDPYRRARESEWKGAFCNMRDAIWNCPHCGAENIYLFQGHPTCWACRREHESLFYLQIHHKRVVLSLEKKLYPHHIQEERLYDFSEPVGCVVSHPKNPALLGLKNLSPFSWGATAPTGEPRVVEPERSITLLPGMKLQFGQSQAEIIKNIT